MPDSRQFVSELVALLDRPESESEGRSLLVRAPAPGLWRGAPEPGTLIRPGSLIGELEQLGVLHRLRAPEQVEGIVTAVGEGISRARRPVDRGSLLLTIDPELIAGSLTSTASSTGAGSATASDGTLVVRSPSAGRFYARPAPDKPVFIAVGQVLSRGQTLGVLEVMKTFTRIYYDDPRLPEQARITAIVVHDQDEIDAGAVLVRLEPLEVLTDPR